MKLINQELPVLKVIKSFCVEVTRIMKGYVCSSATMFDPLTNSLL